MSTPCRVLFYGSPDFATPILSALLDTPWRPLAVVTQPDRPAGRGRRLRPPAVKQLAAEHEIPAIQPERLRRRAAVAQIAALQPDLQIVAAYGQLIPKSVLNLPRYGTLNVHASLLPRWRGAAPVSAAILHGDDETGATIMLVDETEDTGPILKQRKTRIGATEHAGSLSDRLALLGAELLVNTIPDWLDGAITPLPQDNQLATRARRVEKSAGKIDWTQPASQIARHIRAYTPWPGAMTRLDGESIRIAEAHEIDGSASPPGRIIDTTDSIEVATGSGVLRITRLQRAGKREMSAEEFARGVRALRDQRFDVESA